MIELAIARRGSGSPPPLVTSANGQVISMCARDPHIRSLFLVRRSHSRRRHAPGVRFAPARRDTVCPSGSPRPTCFTTSRGSHRRRGATFFLLGAAPDVMQRRSTKVRQRYRRSADCRLSGMAISPTTRWTQVIAEINAARPDILWIGMGVPREQSFALRHRDRLTNVGVIKTSGGLFDFLSERRSRRPLLDAIGRAGMALSPVARAAAAVPSLPHHQSPRSVPSADRRSARAGVARAVLTLRSER